MVDKKDKRVDHFRETGERKAARKALAPFVKLYQEFLLCMSSDDDGSLKGSRGIFGALLNIFFGNDKKISPEEVKVVTTEGEEEPADLPEKETVVDTLDLQSMTHLYRKKLVSRLSTLFTVYAFYSLFS